MMTQLTEVYIYGTRGDELNNAWSQLDARLWGHVCGNWANTTNFTKVYVDYTQWNINISRNGARNSWGFLFILGNVKIFLRLPLFLIEIVQVVLIVPFRQRGPAYPALLTHCGLVTPYDDTDVNIVSTLAGSGNGLLPDGNKLLPVPMLTDHQWSPVTFILQEMPQTSISKIRLSCNAVFADVLATQGGK